MDIQVVQEPAEATPLKAPAPRRRWLSTMVPAVAFVLLTGATAWAYTHQARLVYLFGPPGVLALLRAMAPGPTQEAAPLVSLYAGIVYAILFLVPVSLKGVFLENGYSAD